MDLADLRIRVDSRSLLTATKRLDAFSAAAAKAQPALNAMSSSSARASGAVARVGTAAGGRTTQQLDTFSNKLREMSKASVLLQGPLGGTAARLTALAGIFDHFNTRAALTTIAVTLLATAMVSLVFSAIRAADSYNMLEARTKVMVGSLGNATFSFNQLFEISKRTGTSMEVTSDVFNRVSIGARELGKSTTQILGLVEAVQKLGTLSGANQNNLQAGLLQFGQSLGAGIVRAEEYNSIMENIPALAVEIAKGLDVSSSTLRKMVIDGKLLSKDVFDALSSRAILIDKQFEQMPKTIARAFNELKVNFFQLAGELDNKLGVTDAIVKIIESINQGLIFIRNNLDAIVRTIQVLGSLAVLAGMVAAFTALAPLISSVATGLLTIVGIFATVTTSASSAMVVLVGIGAALQILGGVAIAAGLVALIAYFLDLAGKLEQAKISLEDFNSKQEELFKNTVLANGKLYEYAKTYDEISKKVKKTESDKEILRTTEAQLAKQMGITETKLKEQVKQYGSLSDVVLNYIATTALLEQKKVLENQILVTNTALWWANVRAQQAASAVYGYAGAKTGQKSAVGSAEAEAARKKVEKYEKELAQYEKELADFNDPAKFQAMIKDKLGATKDILAGGVASSVAKDDKAKKSKADPYKEYLNDLAAEEKMTRALLSLRDLSLDQYQKQKIMLEAEAEVRKKNFKISQQEEQALIQRVASQKLAEKQEAVINGQRREIKQEILDTKALTEARKMGIAAYQQEIDKQEIDSQLRSMGAKAIGIETEMRRELTEQIKAKNTLADTINLENLKIEYQDQLALAQALNSSTEAYHAQARAIAVRNATQDITDPQKRSEAMTIIQNTEATKQLNTLKEQQMLESLLFTQAQERLAISETQWIWDTRIGEYRNKALEEAIFRQEKELELKRQGRQAAEGEIEQYVKLKMGIEEVNRQLEFKRQAFDTLENALRNYGERFLDAFDTALRTGEFNFREFTISILSDITKMIIQMEVLSRLFGGKDLFGNTHSGIFSTLFGLGKATGGGSVAGLPAAFGMITKANGGAFNNGAITAFANGGVVGSPTMFPMKNGMGLMGEAGPEAIMPLTRMSNGKLGVASSSGGTTVVQNINVSVDGRSGDPEQNQDLAEKIGKQIKREVHGMVAGEIKEQMRHGNMLRPGLQF